MRGLGARALGSTQVSDWLGRRHVRIPSGYGSAVVTSMVSVGNTGTGVVTASVSHGAVIAGDVIVVLGVQYLNQAGVSISSVAASGLSFTNTVNSAAGVQGSGLWWAVAPDNTARSVTITVSANTSSSTAFGMHIYTVRGANTTNPIGGYAQSTLASGSSLTMPSTSVNPGSCALGVVQTIDDNTLTTASTGWTNTYTAANWGTNGAIIGAYRNGIVDTSGDMVVTLNTNGPDAGTYIRAIIQAA